MTTTAAPTPDIDDRGITTVAERAVERIAAEAVTEVDGVGGAAGRVLGIATGGEDPDRSAKVTATVANGCATLAVRLSVVYPRSVAATTDAARRHLRRRVAELTGLPVTRVDITISALHTNTATARRVQ
ncbi:Asp23/Gls24 family envelope stress response protein [Amycolatopsis methanolica]|uniref:Asp23/Gls24 family envelope stress response protein n=1 Tax=Amycolatopsis methanolica TaxID=1814 RepID=UPI003432F29E